MTLLEALEAAKADDRYYLSGGVLRDTPIEQYIVRLQVLGGGEEKGYTYRYGVIYRVSRMGGDDERVFYCRTVNEVHREQRIAAEIEDEMERMCSPGREDDE